jgi:perosamine synthetase
MGGQALDQTDINAVTRVLRSPYLTQGEEVNKFEEAVASYVGARYAVVVNSGIAALNLACLACEIGPGDEGITSPITFLGTANALYTCGARPDFADITPQTHNIRPSELDKQINKNTRVVIPIHFVGQSCDMAGIREVVSRKEAFFGHRIFIIEDASHALGSLYKGRQVGCCDYSDAVVFSFHPVKHITTGEGGGMVVTQDQALADRVQKLRTHGITKDPTGFINKNLAFSALNSVNPWYYEQHELGYNYRITDFQAALGRSQLGKLPWFLKRRRKIVNEYNQAFKALPNVTIPFETQECESNFHLYVLQIDFSNFNFSRSEFMAKLKTHGILTQVHYIPVYLQPYYRQNFGSNVGSCQVAEKYYEKCISLPLYPSMDNEDVAKVVKYVREILAFRQS